MRAMVLERPGTKLVEQEWDEPQPGAGEVRLRVEACGVCRTDLHVVDGELPFAHSPIVPGHEIVGRVEAIGPGVSGIGVGQRLGVPWLGRTCGCCDYCRDDRENLCDEPVSTGCTVNGGYATQVIAAADWCLPLDGLDLDPVSIAPLLCAGLIGWRALRMAGDGERLGLYGFGAAASLLAQIAVAQGREVYAFARPGDTAAQDFARELGAAWAGASDQRPPVALDAAILCSPRWARWCRWRWPRCAKVAGGLRRHPHERYPELPLPAAVAGARTTLGSQLDPRRWPRADRRGQRHAAALSDGHLPACSGQSGAG